jgi:hypothetical protein
LVTEKKNDFAQKGSAEIVRNISRNQ